MKPTIKETWLSFFLFHLPSPPFDIQHEWLFLQLWRPWIGKQSYRAMRIHRRHSSFGYIEQQETRSDGTSSWWTCHGQCSRTHQRKVAGRGGVIAKLISVVSIENQRKVLLEVRAQAWSSSRKRWTAMSIQVYGSLYGSLERGLPLLCQPYPTRIPKSTNDVNQTIFQPTYVDTLANLFILSPLYYK